MFHCFYMIMYFNSCIKFAKYYTDMLVTVMLYDSISEFIFSE